jgi:hypothetical protein
VQLGAPSFACVDIPYHQLIPAVLTLLPDMQLLLRMLKMHGAGA